jgi:hypothetical protein
MMIGGYKGPAGEYEQIWQLQPKKHFLWIHGAFCFIFKIFFNLKKTIPTTPGRGYSSHTQR